MSAVHKTLDYRDLESELHSAVSMSEIACEMADMVQAPANRVQGSLRISDGEMELLSFAVFHANSLVLDLKRKWNEVHESSVAARAAQNGGAK